MIYRLMIFLMLCGIAAANVNCLVGGSSASANNAGWYAPGLFSPSQTHSGNGAPIDFGAGGAATDSGGFVLITETNQFSDTVVGMYINCDFTNNTHADGRYVISVVNADDSVVIELAYISDEGVQGWTVGGAVPATYNAVSYDLEDVLDDTIGSAASQNVVILIYLASPQEITEQIMVDSNGGSGAFRKTLRGVDINYAARPLGSYVEYIDTDNNAADDIFVISVPNITFENIAAKNPNGPTGDPADRCFDIVSAAKEFVARNCRAVNGYYGFYLAATGSSLVDCVVYDNRVTQAYFLTHGASILGGYYEFNRNNSYSGARALYFGGISGKVVGATIVGDVTGIEFNSYGSHLVLNCNLRDQTTQAIRTNNNDAMLLCFNNIFKLNATNLVEVTLTLGSMYSDFNISNVLTANTILTGANDVSNLTSMDDTNPWVDATKFTDDYKLNRTAGLIDYALDAGWAPYMFIGTTASKQSIGAFPTYDLPAKTSVIAPDTVYGIEGTGSGNGNGGFPATSMLGGLIQE